MNDITTQPTAAQPDGPGPGRHPPRIRLVTLEDMLNLPTPEWLID